MSTNDLGKLRSERAPPGGKGINEAHKISRDTYIEGHGGSSGGMTATRRERSEKKRWLLSTDT